MSVVQKQAVGAAEGGHEQIEIAVPIDVDKGRSESVSTSELEAALASDVLELPVPEVLVERAWAAHPGEKDVHESVAVDISQCHAGAESEVAIQKHGVLRDTVDEVNAQVFRGQLGESGVITTRYREFPPTVAVLVVPDDRRRRTLRTARVRQEDERAKGHTCLDGRKARFG